ncbi:hypothetical protein J2T13_002419 [Paenibacillus sp. DS2015]
MDKRSVHLKGGFLPNSIQFKKSSFNSGVTSSKTERCFHYILLSTADFGFEPLVKDGIFLTQLLSKNKNLNITQTSGFNHAE